MNLEKKLSIKNLVDIIREKYPNIPSVTEKNINKFTFADTELLIDEKTKKYSFSNLAPAGRQNIFDLNSKENFSVVMVLVKILNKGYSINSIKLEKQFQVGHRPSYLDLYLKNPDGKDVYMIEVKSNKEIEKYVSCHYPEDTKQAISYAFQDRNTRIVSYYTFDFDSKTDKFYNIWLDENNQTSGNVDDFYDVWNQTFDLTDYIENNGIFNFSFDCLKYRTLLDIKPEDTKIIFSKFQNLLRVHSVSDKPNAFTKFINLLISKVVDEVQEDTAYTVKDNLNNSHQITGLKCQYLIGIDTPESLNGRLNQLYKEGMERYLNKKVVNYSDDEIQRMIRIGSQTEIKKMINDLSLKTENPFAFIEIYNEETFNENFIILSEMLKIIQNYKFKYDYKQQFLGDFFEELLNTSLKQEAGQFFTPMPIVDFIISSIPYEEDIERKLVEDRLSVDEALPKVIDYACGSGHFLTSSMSKTQNVINRISQEVLSITNRQKEDLKMYSDENHQYIWVNENNVVGIEKDYRLAKATKITTYLNGDGRASILNADGIDKLNSTDYTPCQSLYRQNPNKADKEASNCSNSFDYIISNPPYSVEGFIKNFRKSKIEIGDGTFSLYSDKYKENSKEIETFFVERAYQLSKPNGITAIVLPQSVLSGDNYVDLRKFIFKYFYIKSLVLTSDITFSGTTTSPVIMFLKKKSNTEVDEETDEDILIITSPKYRNPKLDKITNKEKEFLGYSFSSNRKDSGIKIYEKSGLLPLSEYVRKHILGEGLLITNEDSQYVCMRKKSEICLGDTNAIYPKYKKSEGKKIGDLCYVNARTKDNTINGNMKYIEIGDIKEGTVKYSGEKSKTSGHICKKGDILLSSLCPTEDKIVIANDDYLCSPAIYVLTPKEGVDINKLLAELKTPEVLSQMNNITDGFKVTYSKISQDNLKEYICIKI